MIERLPASSMFAKRERNGVRKAEKKKREKKRERERRRKKILHEGGRAKEIGGIISRDRGG